METFSQEKENFEVNEFNIVEGESAEQIEQIHDNEIHRNLEDQSQAYESERVRIPYEAMTPGDRRRLFRLEKKLHRKKQQYEYKTYKAQLKAELKAEQMKYKANKPKKYHWAFFLSSTLIGLGVGIGVVDNPAPLFIGAGLGLLFFIDPIYDQIVDSLKTDR